MARKLQVNLGDAPVRLVVALCLEWRFAHEKLVAQHAKGPQVDLNTDLGLGLRLGLRLGLG